MAACDSNEVKASNDSKQSNKTTTENNDSELSQAEWMEQQDKKQGEVKAEVTNKVFYTWNDESTGGTPTVVAYASIKNTGKTTIDVSQSKVTFLNGSGEVIRSVGANQIYQNLSPSVIKPGEIAYLALSEDAGEEFEDLKDIQVEVFPMVVEFEPIKLNAQKVKVIKTNDWGGSVNVTGLLQNESDKVASEIQAAAGLYDKQNKIIGALVLSSNDSTTIQPKSQSGIEFGVPGFPSSKVSEVDHADIRAISLDVN